MDIPEEVNVLLQELPDQWINTKKIATIVKQQVAPLQVYTNKIHRNRIGINRIGTPTTGSFCKRYPLQATEVVSIRNKITNFDAHILFFRDVFRNYDFFKFSCEHPYEILDLVHNDIVRLENVMKDIQSSGSLFEVNVPEFKILKQCRKELKLLKVWIRLKLG